MKTIPWVARSLDLDSGRVPMKYAAPRPSADLVIRAWPPSSPAMGIRATGASPTARIEHTRRSVTSPTGSGVPSAPDASRSASARQVFTALSRASCSTRPHWPQPRPAKDPPAGTGGGRKRTTPPASQKRFTSAAASPSGSGACHARNVTPIKVHVGLQPGGELPDLVDHVRTRRRLRGHRDDGSHRRRLCEHRRLDHPACCRRRTRTDRRQPADLRGGATAP